MKENDAPNWYALLKAPLRGYVDLDMYTENVNTTFGLKDISTQDINNDNENEEVTNVRGSGDEIM